MKAWRKHNASCTRNKTPQWRLKTKLERRTHFQSEVAFPSPLLLALFKNAGLPTPEIMP